MTEGGGADKAGLQAGDVITEFNGRPVADSTELIVAIRAMNPGDKGRTHRQARRRHPDDHRHTRIGLVGKLADPGVGRGHAYCCPVPDIGLGEVVVMAILALLIFGPERLPKVAADAGRLLRQVRELAAGRPKGSGRCRRAPGGR